MFDNEFLEFGEAKEKDLAHEIDVLPWQDLVRHFAFGRLYVVRKPLTLLEAAKAMKSDDAARLKTAMEKLEFGVPTQDEAQLWHETDRTFEVLVLSPFVLVAPLD